MSNTILPPLTFITYSLGCRTNQAEMESISLQLIDYGLLQTDNRLQPSANRLRQPDLILINTCVVTQKAEKETRQKIRELRKKYPKCFLVVLGCGVNAKEKFKIDLPEADLYISNENKKDTLEIIKSKLLFEPSREQSTEFFSTPPTDTGIARRITLSNKYISSGRKFIKIQDGCDKFCSFCITCHLRGKPTSLPAEKIIEEINYWVDKGIKEIILTGINIGLYGNDIHHQHYNQVLLSFRANEVSRGIPFSISTKERDPSTEPVPSEVEGVGMTITKLVDRILKETEIERISFSSIYPEMLTEDFIKLIVNNPRISQYLHLSLQSGSQTVLQRMNRKYNINELTDYLLAIKKVNPFFTFRADLITGFPNETEKEFQETLEFIKKVKISFIHPFHFSTRQGTKAEQMISSKEWHEVTSLIKKQRTEILNKEVEKIRKEETGKMVGMETKCLIVILLSRYLVEGITENGWPVRMYNVQGTMYNLKGKIVPIKIIGFEKDYLIGEILSFPTD